MVFLKAVKNLKEIFKCELGKEIGDNKVIKIKCKVCIIKSEKNIIEMKGFSKFCINGTSVKKDHHLHPAKLEKNKN